MAHFSAPGFDCSADAIRWSGDGRTLYATMGDQGRVRLFAIDLASGKVTPLTREGQVASFTAAADRALDRAQIDCGQLGAPDVVEVSDPAGLGPARLDGDAPAFTATRHLVRAESAFRKQAAHGRAQRAAHARRLGRQRRRTRGR